MHADIDISALDSSTVQTEDLRFDGLHRCSLLASQTLSIDSTNGLIKIGLTQGDTVQFQNKNGIYSSINNSQDVAVTSIGVPSLLNFDANTFVIDGSNNRVGIGMSSPSAQLHMNGDFILGNSNGFYSTIGNFGGPTRQTFRIGTSTASPYKFVVYDNLDGASTMLLNNPVSGGALAMTKGNTFLQYIGSASTWQFGYTGNDAAFASYLAGVRFYTSGSGIVKVIIDRIPIHPIISRHNTKKILW